MSPRTIAFLLIALGFGALMLGVALIYPPAAFILGGAAAIATGLGGVRYDT